MEGEALVGVTWSKPGTRGMGRKTTQNVAPLLSAAKVAHVASFYDFEDDFLEPWMAHSFYYVSSRAVGAGVAGIFYSQVTRHKGFWSHVTAHSPVDSHTGHGCIVPATTTNNNHTPHHHHHLPHHHHHLLHHTPTTGQTVLQRHTSTQSKHLSISSGGTSPLYFKWHAFYGGIP